MLLFISCEGISFGAKGQRLKKLKWDQRALILSEIGGLLCVFGVEIKDGEINSE